MQFIKNIFKNKPERRQLNNVKDLLTDDIIVMSDSFGLPESLRKQEFQVSSVNSYEYEHSTQTEWVLKGSDNELELYLSLDEDDKVYLKFAMKIVNEDVETLFDLDDFSQIFEPPGKAFLNKKQDSTLSSGWTCQQYEQTIFAQVGYFHRKDHRSEALSVYDDVQEGESKGEAFELYGLLNQSQDKGIELEVWQDGDTDVFLTYYRPTSDIVDMYPGS